MADFDPKSVVIGGNVVGTLLDVFRDDDELIEQLRRRAAFVGASFGIIDEFSGLGEGSTTKYLSAARTKQLTMSSLLKISRVLGLKALLMTDEAQTRRMQRLWIRRSDKRAHSRRPPALGRAQLKRFLKPIASEMGRRGAASWLARTTPEQRRELGRRGAAVRWGHRTSEYEAGDVHPSARDP
jgi:hypothetical protein